MKEQLVLKPKFKIDELVRFEFDQDLKNVISAFSIKEILTQTCYATTQIFYLGRRIFAKKEFDHAYKEEGNFEWKVAHIVTDNTNMTWAKYREDELIKLSKEEESVFLNSK